MNDPGRIRDLGPRDARRIFEIWSAAKKASAYPVGGRWGLEAFEQTLALGRSLGVEAAGDLTCFVLGRESGGGFEILQLATDPAWGRQGFMKTLVEHLKLSGRYRELWLEVHSANIPAQRLYEASGFEIVGRRKKYYSDGQDALLMSWRNPLP